MFHSSHLGDLSADVPSAPTPSSNATVPAPMHPAFPLLAIGGLALMAYLVMAAVKDGPRGGVHSTDE